MKNFILVAFLFVVSCATTIKDFEKYNKSPMLQSQYMPKSSDLQKNLPSVVIFEIETEDRNAIKISGTKTVENSLGSILMNNKLAVLQDRSKLEKLKNEIRLAETSGGKTSSIKAVDFAIDGNISSVTFSSQFLSETRDERGNIMQPNRHQYTANVNGSIKIYEIPSLVIIGTVNFSGSAIKTEEQQQGSKLSIGKFKFNEGGSKGKEFDEGLAQKAVQNAMQNMAPKFMNYFAKKGYIMEKRTYNGKNIFLVNLGSNDGIKQEDVLEISQKYSELNPLTGEEETSIRVIGTGKVADKTESGKTWIVVKDEKTASLIRIGDIVKVTY